MGIEGDDDTFSNNKNGNHYSTNLFENSPQKENEGFLLKRESDMMFDLSGFDSSQYQIPPDEGQDHEYIKNELSESSSLPEKRIKFD